ncbi:ABC transporter ATP-binding protein [Opitutus sp. ER46]|uniref:ABC transporter ATP-binding protein n=1 Tax=Opitutus sp. ER46 TaxID=2161864 RepID=UPI000D31B554|nr:ABC transporter ATP-binding protein [Opitutus sp. ER46]PTX96659.1 ABC transporter ATP-binding protein [Opitutus sp. ER46]
MILTRALTKRFGARQVLTGLDLTVEPGSVTLMIGANGAGKTTTMRLLAGLAEADSGDVVIAGHDLRTARRAALASLSFLPQAPRFHPRLTTEQVLAFHAQLRGRERTEVPGALERWGLLDSARTPTGKLSGGLRQRLALAIFELADTPVRLLDEPGLSLDPEWRERLQSFLLAEARRGGTVLVATHLLGEWEDRASRCILVEHGRCRGDISPERLRDTFLGVERFPGLPREPFAACG